MLDYRPAKFFRRQIIRRKFVRKLQTELPPIIAPLPESLQQRCIAAPGLVAQVIVSKFCDHLPLYRQQQIYTEPAPGLVAASKSGPMGPFSQ
jgi:transposase